MLGNLKIRTKLTSAFLAVIALAMLAGGVAVVRLIGVAADADDLSQKSIPTVKLANELERDSLKTMYAVRGYHFTSSKDFLERGRQEMTKVRQAVQKTQELARTQNLPELAHSVEEAAKSVDLYDKLFEQTVRITDDAAAAQTKLANAAEVFLQQGNAFLDDQLEAAHAEAKAEGAPSAALLERVAKTFLMARIIDQVQLCRVANFRSQALRDPVILETAMANFDRIAALLEEIRKLTRLEVNIRQLDAIQQAVADYKSGLQNRIRLVRELDAVGNQRISAGEKILEQAQAAAEKAIDQTETAETAAVASIRLAQVFLVAGLLLAAVLGVVIALVLTRSIVNPLGAVMQRMKAVAAGDLSADNLVNKNKDEIGQLTQSVNDMCVSLRKVVGDVAGTAKEVASAATQIAASSEEMAGGMKEQTQQVTQISSAIEEMSASIVEVAKKSAEAAQNAGESGKTAEEGGKVVSQTISDMQEISQVVSASAASVTELGKRGQQIGQIIDVINDIADQTNLLALNAAIEAARAGEHGRGFAVVADEVRKLADRTTKATEEIASSIQAIQSETTTAVGKMTAGTEKVEQGVGRATEAGTSLEKIVAGSRTVADMVRSIAAAAEEQSAASEQVTRNIESINAVTRQASEGAGQAASAAAQLSSKAEQLQRLVGQFKLDETRRAAA